MSVETETKKRAYKIADIPTEGVVKIKTIETIKGRPRVLQNARKTLAPFYDMDGRVVTGTLESEWKQWTELVNKDINKEFWRDFNVVLTNRGKEYNLAVPINRLIIAFLKAHYEVALEEAQITKDNSFVIYDEVEKAKEKNISFEEELRALTAISKMTAAEKADFLKLFGYKVNSMHPDVIQAKLADIAKNDSVHFNSLYKDQNKELRILVKDLVFEEILHRKEGMIMHGDTCVGATEDLAVIHLSDADNQNLLITLKKQLKAKKDRK